MPPVLALLLLLNGAVFLLVARSAGSVEPTVYDLYRWGGNFGAVSLHGQPWRLVTALFLHAGVGHILGNMVLLLITGSYLERRLGSLRFLGAYLSCGVVASACSAWWHPTVLGVGASGAVAGVLGILVALWLGGAARDVNGAWVAQTVGLNALYSFAPNVDWVAHAGGFAAGLAWGAAILAAR